MNTFGRSYLKDQVYLQSSFTLPKLTLKKLLKFTMSVSYKPLPDPLPISDQQHTLVVLGGGGRDRTDDLKLAKLPLSQLSYAP